MRTEYHFFSHWEVPATCEEVYDVLSQAETLPRWWPSVYLDVRVTEAGDKDLVGKKVELYTKGWLPYTLRWNFITTETHRPFGFSFDAFGDFVGFGKWEFTQEKETCKIDFEWKLEVGKAFLKRFSFLLKPVFAANHRWAMKQGEKSLKLELAKRKGLREGLTQKIPLPPGPTFPHNLTDNKVLSKSVISGQ